MQNVETSKTWLKSVICFINQKGGCGKSSSCFHLAGTLAQAGNRVLLVDADPQGSLSQGFFGSQLVECLAPQETLAALFQQDFLFDPTSLVVKTPFLNISMIRANQHLAQHNGPSPETTGLQQFALDSLLNRLDAFDIVLIDCPPNLYTCSWNGLLAADWVVIPVPPEDFGTQGLRAVHQAIENAQLLNHRLRLLGHLVTRHDKRLLIHRAYEQKLRSLYGESVFKTVIPEASAFKVALAGRQPVTYFSPRSKAGLLTSALACEIVDTIDETTENRNVA
jgi:chromosome partitioning protein